VSGGRDQVSSFPPDGPFAYPLQWYENFAAVIAGEVGYRFGLGAWSSRMTTTGGAFYGAWHAGFSVEVGDLSTDQPVGVLTLEEYNDWIHGADYSGGAERWCEASSPKMIRLDSTAIG
jgi:hypothetical protein